MSLPELYNEDGQPVNVFRELGKRKSEAKTLAARKNGAKGGPKSWKRKPTSKPKAKKAKHGKLSTQDFI